MSLVAALSNKNELESTVKGDCHPCLSAGRQLREPDLLPVTTHHITRWDGIVGSLTAFFD